jgi:hypothetical protein
MFIVKTVPGLEGFSTEQQDLYNIPRGENSAKIRKNPHPRAKKQIEEAPRWKAW